MGDDEVDGVSTHHLGAVAPGQIQVQDLGLGAVVPAATTAIESVEVWVADDGLVPGASTCR